MGRNAATRAWDEAEADEEFPYRQPVDVDLTAPICPEDLAAPGVHGSRSGSWTGQMSGWINVGVGLHHVEVRAPNGL